MKRNGKVLKMGDGMMHFNGYIRYTNERHLAVRNAIIQHRNGNREPLAIPPGGYDD